MRVLVLGAAVSGRAAVGLLRSLGDSVTMYDADPAAGHDLAGTDLTTGRWDARLLDDVDLVVTSPGIPPSSPPLADALGRHIPVWSEIELASRHIDVPLGAVTGTNGKTTVTEVAAAMLGASGLRAAAVGNIGDPLCGAVGSDREVLVVEASSFQLRFVETFRASGAVLLNVAPDHLDWHGDLESYVAAKQRILERQSGDDIVVFDVDDDGAVRAVQAASAQRVEVSGSHVTRDGFGPDGPTLRFGDAAVDIAALARSDHAYLTDMAAAGALALHLGATHDGVVTAAVAYAPGRHRRQVVGEWHGVTWVNDSKATNPHAALDAIRSFSSVVLIAGGRAKGLDLAPLAAEPNVKHVIGIGEAGPVVVAAARSATLATDMKDAVSIAATVATPEDTVLLAPGAASFDMFASYADRGDQFMAAIDAQRRM